MGPVEIAEIVTSSKTRSIRTFEDEYHYRRSVKDVFGRTGGGALVTSHDIDDITGNAVRGFEEQNVTRYIPIKKL
jgi:hypothetical protein